MCGVQVHLQFELVDMTMAIGATVHTLFAYACACMCVTVCICMCVHVRTKLNVLMSM